MTTLPIQLRTTSRPAGKIRYPGQHSVGLEAFFGREASRGLVTLRLMLLGAAIAVAFAALGYALFGAGNQHQFFRDIGPVTAFAVLMTFAVGYIGMLIARREQPGAGPRRWLNFWFLSGAGFLLLTFDAPLDLHGRLGHFIDARATVAQDIGFHGSGDAILAVYMLTGMTVAAVYWREMLRHPRVMAHLFVGGLFIAGTIGIDGFAEHSSSMWVLEESVELIGLAWIVGAFAIRLEAAALREDRKQPILVA
jgi:hypothetical protein